MERLHAGSRHRGSRRQSSTFVTLLKDTEDKKGEIQNCSKEIAVTTKYIPQPLQ